MERKQKVVPLEQIVPETFNKEFFEDVSAVLNKHGAVAVCVVGSTPPPSEKHGFFVMSPPGIGPEMLKIALQIALEEITNGDPNQEFGTTIEKDK